MAKVTEELVKEIGTLCEITGWQNDIQRQVVSLHVKDHHMSITYEAIAELMELHGLTLENALRKSYADSQSAPMVRMEDVEDLPVVELRYVDRVDVGTLFFSSVSELAAVEGTKDQSVVWVCKRTDGGFCRVPLAVRVDETSEELTK